MCRTIDVSYLDYFYTSAFFYSSSFALELSPFFSGILNIGTFGLLHYFNEFSAVFRRRDFVWLLFYLSLSACIAVFN